MAGKSLQSRLKEQVILMDDIKNCRYNVIGSFFALKKDKSCKICHNIICSCIKIQIGRQNMLDNNIITKIVCENIKCLCLENDIKIGDLEKKCGFQKGYFSRIIKENSTTKLSVDACYIMSDLLNISIDKLTDQNLLIETKIKNLEREKKELQKRELELKYQIDEMRQKYNMEVGTD